MVTVRRLLIGGPDGKRDIRESPGGEWGAVGRRGIVTRTRIPAGRRNGTGNRQALSQWGPVNTTNRFSMLSNPPRLYRSKSYCRCFHSDHLGQGLLPLPIHPSIRIVVKSSSPRKGRILLIKVILSREFEES